MAVSLFWFVTLMVSAAQAHLCLLSPPQRGSMVDINKPGAVDCFLLDSPCGGRPLGTVIQIIVGSNFTVTFQKNLDHWTGASPGYFDVTLISGQGKEKIVRIKDMGEPSLHLYSLNFTMPQLAGSGNFVLQVTYVTKNPAGPAVLYQCSDLKIVNEADHGNRLEENLG